MSNRSRAASIGGSSVRRTVVVSGGFSLNAFLRLAGQSNACDRDCPRLVKLQSEQFVVCYPDLQARECLRFELPRAYRSADQQRVLCKSEAREAH